MKKLRKDTKSRVLTLREIYDLYRSDTGVETAEFIVKTLDVCYPNYDRDDVDVFSVLEKFHEHYKTTMRPFSLVMRGMTRNE